MNTEAKQLVLLNQYNRAFSALLESARVIMEEADENAETMDMQLANGYTVSEDIAIRCLALQKHIAEVGTDFCKDLIIYTKEVREEFE